MSSALASQPAGLANPIAAITDEFSFDLDQALDAMVSIGMTGVELRVIGGRNILDLTDEEVDQAVRSVQARGMDVPAIASPLLSSRHAVTKSPGTSRPSAIDAVI